MTAHIIIIAVVIVDSSRGRMVKSADISFGHLSAVSDVDSSPTRGICETSQVLCSFSRGSSFFVPPADWPVSYELK